MVKKYNWILFDNDNTIIDFHGASHIAFHDSMRSLGLNEDEIDYAQYSECNHIVWSEFEKGIIDAYTLRAKRFELYFEAVNHTKVDPREANAKYLDHLVLNPLMITNAAALLHDLKPHYQLGLITNGLKEVQRPRLKSAKIYDHFDVIIVSDEIGYAKPQKAYFDYTIQEMKEDDLSKILVVGDSLHSDILGAQNYGLDSCWYNPANTEAHPNINATYMIQHIDEIKALLL